MFDSRSSLSVMLGVVVIGVAGCAGNGPQRASSEEPTAIEVEKVTVPEYREFLGELREAVDNDIPRELNPRETREFERLHGKLMNLLADRDSIEDLSEDERIALFNTHEELQVLISGRRDYQVICRRRHTVGTNFKHTECYTRQEWQEASERSREYLHNNMRSPMTPPSDG